MDGLRQEWQRWHRANEVERGGELVGRIGDCIPPARDHLRGLITWIEDGTAEDSWADAVYV